MSTEPILPWLAVVVAITLLVAGWRWLAHHPSRLSRAGNGNRTEDCESEPSAASSASSGGGKFQMPDTSVLVKLGFGILALILLFAVVIPWWNSDGPERAQERVEQGVKEVGDDLSDYVEPESAPMAKAGGDEIPLGAVETFPPARSGLYTGEVLVLPGFDNCVELPRDKYRVHHGDGYQQFQSTGAARKNVRIFRVREDKDCPTE